MILGTKRPMGRTAKQTLDLRASIHNRFDVEVLDAATGEVKQRARGYNVICQRLWAHLFHTSSGAWSPEVYFRWILYGRGSGTPSASDTALFDRITAIQVYPSVDVSGFLNGVIYAQGVATIQAEESVGETITEVGIGDYSGSGGAAYSTTVATHAMLEDMNGNPISISKTATDVIKIYATVYVHFTAGGFYGGTFCPAIRFSGSGTYAHSQLWNMLCGCFTSGSYSELQIVLVERGLSNQYKVDVSGTPTVTVSAADKQISFTQRLPAAQGNTPIRAMLLRYFSGSGPYNYGDAFVAIAPGGWFTPPAITGEAVGTGDGTTTVFHTAFPIGSGATVKVDGVTVSGVTVRGGPPQASDAGAYFNTISFGPSGDPYYDFYADTGSGSYARYRENPYTALGIASVTVSLGSNNQTTVTVDVSDDAATWTQAGTKSGFDPHTIDIPAALRTKKYFRFTPSASGVFRFSAVADASAGNIVFDTAPAAGAVITVDYTPDCIAKDENHVFDLTTTLTLGEYSEV